MSITAPASPLSDVQHQQLQNLLRDLNPQQIDWVQGYLAGFREALQPAPTTPGQNESTLSVLFGSQTGNAEALAHLLTERARERGLKVECMDMNDFPVRRLKKEQQVAIITSTHGEGDPPDSALGLHEFLHSRKAPRLDQLKFAVLALGDSSYEYFCKTGADFDAQLSRLGAERLLDRVDCDLDYEESAEKWIDSLIQKLADQSPATAALQPPSTAPVTNSGYSRKHPFHAPLLDRVCLSARGSTKAVYHLEFSLEESGYTYTPGDSLGVYAQNDPVLVDQLLEQTSLDGSELVTVKDRSVTLSEALQHHLEITRLTPPTVQQWATTSESQTLAGLIENRHELMKWLYGRDVLDIWQDYRVAGLDAQTLVNHLRHLPPRLYSIASSQTAVDDEVHVTVAAVRYHHRGRDRAGVASSWLADRVSVEQTLPVFIDINKNFRLPQDPDTPIIMIGPGTGVAPFRAFMQEREALAQPGANWLFFGDRNFRRDFLYQSEWLNWRKSGLLSRLDVAFSRDNKEKLYVQHRLRENGRELWQWIENGAHVYVCGDASAMAPDVHQALIEAIVAHSGTDTDGAEQYLRNMSQNKRYQRDVY